MKYKNQKRKGSAASKGGKNGKSFSINQDPFFNDESKKRRKLGYRDEDIESEDDSEVLSGSDDGDEEEDQVVEETADEIRKRVAMEQLERKRAMARKDEDGDEEWTSDKEGARDSLVAKMLQQEQLEASGRVRREIASRVKKPESVDGFQLLVKHRHSVTAVALSEDDLRGFSASKDGSILQWDVESGKGERYQWPSEEVLRSHGAKDPQGGARKHSKNILALAVSSDGRYLASGGLDRHVHLWDTRTRQHLQAFPGHRGLVSCLAFRQGTTELFSGSFDRSVKIWNVEDRAYIDTRFGHQSEVLAIDCLRKERVLTVGRDRSMCLFKVPEDTRLMFLASKSHLECCCFINNDEFLSGSDDGNIEHWSIQRKKPVDIVKNAHTLLPASNVQQKHDEMAPNGNIENGGETAESSTSSSTRSWVSSVTVCRGSDLAASGAGNDVVRLWAIESEKKGLRALYDLPLVGFVNSLAFAKSGQFLIAGVGKEPRLGRWECLPAAQNGVAIHPLNLS